MVYFTCCFLLFCIVLTGCNGALELLTNPDFESTDYNGNWWCKACHAAPSTDVTHGQHSIQITNRDKNWKGLIQSVNTTGGKTYRFHSHVKFLNIANDDMYQTMTVVVSCQLGDGKTKYVPFGATPKMKPNVWYEVGDVRTLPDESHNCQLYFQTTANANYLVDDCSLKEVTVDPDWEHQADQRIEQVRKANMSISVHGSTGMNLDIEVTQKSHEFAFGSAVDARKMVDNVHTAYQKAFYDNFEWATLANAYKWKPMEHSKGHINYDTPITATQTLKQHGIKVRGHCVFWGVDTYVQDWVKQLDAQATTSAIHTRIQGIISLTKGTLEHWDVNNENLHGDYYERHTNNSDITMDMFRQIHAIDNQTKLFLNDFNILDYGQSATALKDQALKFKNAGVPIGGIGVQSHLRNLDDQFTAIKGRLDIVVEAGLPIMITELTVGPIHGHSQADRLGDMLKLFFSYPSIEGVVLWGFWDGTMHQHNEALFTGPNVTPNAAGRVYQSLVKNQWMTNTTVHVMENQSTSVRGFKGTYNVKVKHNGHVLKSETVTLSSKGQQIQINLDGQSGGHPTISNILVG